MSVPNPVITHFTHLARRDPSPRRDAGVAGSAAGDATSEGEREEENEDDDVEPGAADLEDALGYFSAPDPVLDALLTPIARTGGSRACASASAKRCSAAFGKAVSQATPPVRWRGFTDSAVVAAILTAHGMEPPPPPYKIYERSCRWYGRCGPKWVCGSSAPLDRMTEEQAVLHVHAACLADANASGRGRLHIKGGVRGGGRGSSARSAAPVAAHHPDPVDPVPVPTEASGVEESSGEESAHSSELPGESDGD